MGYIFEFALDIAAEFLIDQHFPFPTSIPAKGASIFIFVSVVV